MNKTERVARAKAALETLRPGFEKAKAEFKKVGATYESAQQELKAAETDFYPGDRVHIEETCRRGCCVEVSFNGTVLPGRQSNGSYRVQRDSGGIDEYVSSHDMSLIKP